MRAHLCTLALCLLCGCDETRTVEIRVCSDAVIPPAGEQFVVMDGEVVAIDVDADAVEATIRNAELNGCEDRLYATTTLLADLPGTYDVVVSNLTAGVQAGLAADLVGHTSPPGRLILSGLLVERVDPLVIPLGLEELERRQEGDWVALTLGAGA